MPASFSMAEEKIKSVEPAFRPERPQDAMTASMASSGVTPSRFAVTFSFSCPAKTTFCFVISARPRSTSDAEAFTTWRLTVCLFSFIVERGGVISFIAAGVVSSFRAISSASMVSWALLSRSMPFSAFTPAPSGIRRKSAQQKAAPTNLSGC